MNGKTVLSVILLCSFALLTPSPAQSAASYGSGLAGCPTSVPAVPLSNPTVLSGGQCTTAGIQAALNNGGQILLNCGSAPVPITQTLLLNPEKDTLIDGGGVVTLDGLNQRRILFKDWHDPNKVPAVTVTLQNIRLINGKAPGGSSTGETSGGAIQVGHPGTRLHVINATFENNSTTDIHDPDNQGGAIFTHNVYETLISGSLFLNNSAGNGGAIGGIATGMLIYNSRFADNQALDATQGGIVRGYGGALALDGVTNDYNPNSNRTYTVCGSQFENNRAARGGGAIDAVVSDGLGTRAYFEKNTFIGNEVTGIPGQGGQGGAIYHVEDDQVGGSGEDNFEIRDSTFSGNRSNYQGGAVWVSILGRGRVINSTFSGNTTTAPIGTVGQGGGMIIAQGTFDILNTTFANNHAAFQGGALFGNGSQVTLSNTIFYNNTLNVQGEPWNTQWQGYHTSQTMLDGGQNIQYPRYKPDYPGNEVNNSITANPIFLDPLLLSLGSYGGPTQTLALQGGSPAINAANPARCSGLDQRGFIRQGACDIGAFEFGGLPFVPTDWIYLPVVRK